MAKKKIEAVEKMETTVRTVLDIPLERVLEATSNTRRSSWGDLEGLAASMREQGQITPGLVRPIGERFGLVVGARRFRAVKLAGLAMFRAEVRELDDVAAHEIRMIENNQREDVSPLEEAEAFQTARASHGRSVEEIAARLGRTPAYVYQRLRLLELAKEARDLVEADRLGIDSALLLAQLPPEAQRDVVRIVDSSWRRGRRITKADVVEAIDDNMMELGDASFDVADAELVPSAGACTTCPKRTGTQGSLFELVEHDRCLDPECFDVKVKALAKRKIDDAREAGAEVLEGDAAKKVVNSYGQITSAYVELDEPAFFRTSNGETTNDQWSESDDGKEIENTPVTWREVLGPEAKPVVVVSPTGKVVEAAPRDIAHQALAGIDKSLARTAQRSAAADEKLASNDQSYREEQRKAKEKADAEREGKRRAMAALVASIEQPGDTESERAELLRKFVVAMMQGTWADTLNEVCARRGWKLEDRTLGTKLAAADVIANEMADMTVGQVSALAVEIVATRTQSFYGGKSGFEMLLEVRSIDLAHHTREAKKAAKERKKEKAAKKGARGKASAEEASPA